MMPERLVMADRACRRGRLFDNRGGEPLHRFGEVAHPPAFVETRIVIAADALLASGGGANVGC